MAKQKKRRKPTRAKEKIDYKSILIQGLVELIVGALLVLLDKVLDK